MLAVLVYLLNVPVLLVMCPLINLHHLFAFR